MDKYKIGRKAVWGRCDRLGIPKVYEGRNTFYSKKLIDANFSELLDVIDIDNYYTLSQMENPQRCDPVRQTGLTLLKKMLNTLY